MNTTPAQTEYAPYYYKYIRLVPDGNITAILEEQLSVFKKFFSSISEEKSFFRYAENKWSIREVLGHIIDSERIFSYRALRFSREDPQALLSYDENNYASKSNYHNIPIVDIWNEFEALRVSVVLMFKGFNEKMWSETGTASNNLVSVRALAYIIAGHASHHIEIIKERYIVQ